MFLSQIDFIHAHLAQGWFASRSIPTLQVPQINRPHGAGGQPELACYLSGRSHFTRQSHGVLKPLRKRRLARQQGHLLALHAAVRALHPVNLDEHRRRKRAPGKIADRPLAAVVQFAELTAATGALDLSISSFSPYPQFQRLRLLVNLMLIDLVSRPSQNPGELVIRRQTASLAQVQ